MSHTRLLVHVIFATKGRAPMLSEDMLARMPPYIAGLLRKENGALLAAGGVADHVHLLVSSPATRAISDLVRDIKANSSRWVHETFPDSRDFAWQSGYGAFSVSESGVDAVRRYLASQEEHHRRVTFQEEYVAFLQRHNVEYDPKWVFND